MKQSRTLLLRRYSFVYNLSIKHVLLLPSSVFIHLELVQNSTDFSKIKDEFSLVSIHFDNFHSCFALVKINKMYDHS